MSSLWLISSNEQQRGVNQTLFFILRFYLGGIDENLPRSDFKCFSHQGDPTTAVKKNGGEKKNVLEANPSSVLRGNEEKLTLG